MSRDTAVLYIASLGDKIKRQNASVVSTECILYCFCTTAELKTHLFNHWWWRTVLIWNSSMPQYVSVGPFEHQQTFHSMKGPQFIYPFTSWRTWGCLLFGVITTATVNILIWGFVRSLGLDSLEWTSRSGMGGSYGTCIFNFLRSYQTVLPSGCTISDAQQQWMIFLLVPHSCQQMSWNTNKFMLHVTALLGGPFFFLAPQYP